MADTDPAGAESAVGLVLLYPSLLGTYGDGGNATVLAQRLRWRGIPTRVVEVDVEDPVPLTGDLYVLGGGEDAAQTLAVSRLRAVLPRAVARGAAVFAVCAGFQILGESFLDGTGAGHNGLGILDCRTDRLPGPRAVGELLTVPLVSVEGPLTGYENHGGRTTLGPAAGPLGRVLAGVGNGAGEQTLADGAVQGRVVATYLHGPALARNPALADWLLAMVVGYPLPPLDDREERELRRERIAAVRRGRLTRLLPGRRQWRPSARS